MMTHSITSPAQAPSVATSPAVAVGELLWDLLPGGRVLGGAPANFAFRLRSLGTPALLASRVGRDEAGDEAVRLLASNGLPTDLVQRDDVLPTGLVDVSVSEAGNASYVIRRGVAYDAIRPETALLEAASRAPLVCFGTLAQRDDRSRRTVAALLEAAADAVKILDVNLRVGCYCDATVRSSLRAADVVKLNGDEVTTLGVLLWDRKVTPREFMDRIGDEFDVGTCLVTLGDEGVFARGDDGSEVRVAGYRVSVVDTIGAGDAFTAGFAKKLLDGAALEACCEYGNRVGALVATTRGGMVAVDPDAGGLLPASAGRVATPLMTA